MNILFIVRDWYHCEIYRERWFINQLIAEASINLAGELKLEFYNEKYIKYAKLFKTRSYEFLMQSRQ